MPSRRIVLPTILACVMLALASFGAASASASRNQTLFFEAPELLLNPATRAQTISTLQHLGVHAIRVEMPWYEVAPGRSQKNKPSFNASSPASYDWGPYQELLAEAKRLHWEVLLTVTAPVPRWATSNRRAPYVTRPNRNEFKQFMTAVGRQFGSEATLFAIWNEPNEFGYLQPQFSPNGRVPVAPVIYRGLFEAGYAGLRQGGLRNPKVLMGETSPGGFVMRPKKVPIAGVAPLTFLRGALCLTASYRKAPHCRKLPAFGYAQHPYALTTGGPFYKPPNQENVNIGTLGRLVTALNKAARAGAVRQGLPIFLTEFGVMSKPNRYFGVAPLTQAAYDAISERIASESPRVAAFSQYLLKDDVSPKSKSVVSFQTGLEYANGRKKPLYYGFPVPLTVTRERHGFALWGMVRPTNKATKVTILVQRGNGPYRRLAVVHTGRLGYWQLDSNVKGRFWRVRWISPNGETFEGPPIGAYNKP